MEIVFVCMFAYVWIGVHLGGGYEECGFNHQHRLQPLKRRPRQELAGFGIFRGHNFLLLSSSPLK